MKTLQTIAISFLAGIAGAYVFSVVHDDRNATTQEPEFSITHLNQGLTYEATESQPLNHAEGSDFSIAADRAAPSVVYINSISQSGSSASYWDMLFGGGQQTQVSSGSGVIFSADGFIVTNNHVVQTAEKIEVVYNKKVYPAELIGTDPSTDLAVLKINESNLPAITLGSSKNLAVGEWVIAIGNPFSLSSTITAGIVSAKGRRINIVEDKFPIESFIQTDAAINPGNSGGALVNIAGELVGINTAILSRTGSYTGYAFAVPIDIVKKSVNDIVKYGIVQKGLFGGTVTEYDYQNALRYQLSTNVKDFKGVLLEELQRDGAAFKAGLKPGDIILKINNIVTNSKSSFEEELSYHYPGDKITIAYNREGEAHATEVTLLNRNGGTGIVKRELVTDDVLGATLEGVNDGVKVTNVQNGLFRNLPENYTVMSINGREVSDPQVVVEFFKNYKGRVLLYGKNSSNVIIPYRIELK